MRMTTYGALVFAVLFLARLAAAATPGETCAALAHRDFQHFSVTVTKLEESGRLEPTERGHTLPAISGLRGFCRVHGVSHPVPGSEIGIDVWLPLEGWNHRLHVLGNGSYSSSIYWEQM